MVFSKYTKDNALVMFDMTVNIKELIAFLQSNTHITELSLPHCRIGNEGVEALAEGNLKNLTKLDLQVNNIDDEGTKALANGNLKNLTRLNLDCNKISSEGAKALVEGNFTSLTELSLRGNVLFSEADRKILKCNLKNSTLCLVDDDPNCMDMKALLQNVATDLGKTIAREVGFVQAVNQQQESDAQAAASDQPSSKLGGVHPISHSQSMNSLSSDNSDIEIISKSQCR